MEKGTLSGRQVRCWVHITLRDGNDKTVDRDAVYIIDTIPRIQGRSRAVRLQSLILHLLDLQQPAVRRQDSRGVNQGRRAFPGKWAHLARGEPASRSLD